MSINNEDAIFSIKLKSNQDFKKINTLVPKDYKCSNIKQVILLLEIANNNKVSDLEAIIKRNDGALVRAPISKIEGDTFFFNKKNTLNRFKAILFNAGISFEGDENAKKVATKLSNEDALAKFKALDNKEKKEKSK